ncbi:MAG: AraC family transcriptional regulator [Phycisphaerales bacterium]|nr:AraC family transcriptional regulator [Phycisphaerales bacterium]MCB9862493.1 AraC family transcriptional regulator [Phycisphaerales bacterium]
MNPRKEHLEARRFVGISCRTTNAAELDAATGKIPALYERFFAEGVAGQIPDCKDATGIFGVYSGYESDHNGAYTLTVACETELDEAPPSGLDVIDVAAGEFLVFEEAGELPGAVRNLWQRIWTYFEASTEYRRAFEVDFEVYSDEFPGVRIYIALAK